MLSSFNVDTSSVLTRLVPSNDAFVAALHKSGSTRTTPLHLATDHAYSNKRIALETSILNWLATL